MKDLGKTLRRSLRSARELLRQVISHPASANPARVAPKVDLAEVGATPESAEASRLFIRPDYAARPEPQYFDAERTTGWVGNRVWQPDVYAEAGRVARELGARTVVDVGCGDAGKLAPLHPEFRLIGLDFGPNIELCRSRYDFGEWIAHDLELEEPLPLSPDQCENAVVICADVIEHVRDPANLLRKLHAVYERAKGVVISTPDREKYWGPDHTGPSPNPHHVREWSLPEFAALLKAYGFELGTVGFTRSHNHTVRRSTIIAVSYPPSLAQPRLSRSIAPTGVSRSG